MISKSLSGFFAVTFCITKIMYIVNGEKKEKKKVEMSKEEIK